MADRVRVLIAAIMLALASPAGAHDWYPPDCCNGNKTVNGVETPGDCQPVADEDLVEIDGGCWKYLPTGNTFCGTKVRPTKDSKSHVCIGIGAVVNEWGNDKGHSYCVFIKLGS